MTRGDALLTIALLIAVAFGLAMLTLRLLARQRQRDPAPEMLTMHVTYRDPTACLWMDWDSVWPEENSVDVAGFKDSEPVFLAPRYGRHARTRPPVPRPDHR